MEDRPLKPLESGDQKKSLGKVSFRPMQRDLFTGELVTKKIKPGSGDHILLKNNDGPRLVRGMAHFPATGPQDKRCSDCRYLQDIPVWGRGKMTPQEAGYQSDKQPKFIEINACMKAALLMERQVQCGGIQHELACKYFQQAPSPQAEMGNEE